MMQNKKSNGSAHITNFVNFKMALQKSNNKIIWPF